MQFLFVQKVWFICYIWVNKLNNMTGRIYLIPGTLWGDDFLKVIPEKVISLTRHLRFFIVEDIRSARRFLRLIDKEFPINDTVFFELNEHTGETDIAHYLDPVMNGSDIGIMSEAGLPGIADPGARIIALAHKKKIKVSPLSGPSSIILALISSGLNGQNFTFNGYLPVKPAERCAKLRDLEKNAAFGYAQIFMETPYRNQKMLESIIETCHNDTKLCIAADITLPSESIITMKISEWKRNIPSLTEKLVIFVLQ
jgi:16S rRNA (cytidine1402-2'-O)-methyltransferase